MSRYDRQKILADIGCDGQRRLAQAKVLIVGAGGLGSPVSLYLAGAGVGIITIADADTVSITNLQRQVLYTEADLGKPKASAAADRLRQLNSDVCIKAVDRRLSEANAAELIADADLVIDCSDNYATRFLIDDTCAATGRPWIFGAIAEFYGMAALLGHSSGKRLTDIFSEREQLCAAEPSARGVVGPTPGVIGSIQASEAIRLLAGAPTALDGKLFSIDLTSLTTNIIDI